MVGIEEKLFQAATVAEYLIRDRLQAAMSLVHRLDVAVAAPQRDTLQHVRPAGRIWLPVLRRSPHRRMKVGGEGGCFVGVGSLNVKPARSHDEPEQEAEIHLDAQNNPFDLFAIFPVSIQSCSRMVRFVLASSTPELRLA